MYICKYNRRILVLIFWMCVRVYLPFSLTKFWFLTLFCIWVKNFYVYLFEVTTFQFKTFVNSFNSACRSVFYTLSVYSSVYVSILISWISDCRVKRVEVTRDSFIKRNPLRLFWGILKVFFREHREFPFI